MLTPQGLQLPTLPRARTPTLGAAARAERGLPRGNALTLGKLGGMVGAGSEVGVQPGATHPPSSMTSGNKDPKLFTEDEKGS